MLKQNIKQSKLVELHFLWMPKELRARWPYLSLVSQLSEMNSLTLSLLLSPV